MNQNKEQVEQVIQQLKPSARAVSVHAHAPYSHFHVGAALQVSDDRVITGCNMESASYGLTQCAERNALATAIAQGVQPGTIQSLVVYLSGDEPLPPCGACRQVMCELMAENAVVVSCCDSDAYLVWSLDALLPEPFLGR